MYSGAKADDDTMHKLAIRIQSRAIRRSGQLLKEYQADPVNNLKQHRGVGGDTSVTQRQAAEEAGMSKDQEVTESRVANVPEQ